MVKDFHIALIQFYVKKFVVLPLILTHDLMLSYIFLYQKYLPRYIIF